MSNIIDFVTSETLHSVCRRAFCIAPVAWQLKLIVCIDNRRNGGLQLFRRDLALIDE